MYKKSSKISESSGPVVGSTILNRKIPGSNPPRDIFHYYIFLPIITSISNFMCIYTNLSRFVVCAMAQWWEALVTNACWLYVLALIQDRGRDCWGIPQQFCGSVYEGTLPVGRNIPRQLCALTHDMSHIWLLAWMTFCHSIKLFLADTYGWKLTF